MTSNLLNTTYGRAAAREAVCYLAHRRLGRKFKRSFYETFFRWFKALPINRSFSLSDALNIVDLNVLEDNELLELYNLLGTIGCLNQTISDTTIYVDPINGSDTSGNGTQTTPYASLWFLDGLPETINHFYRIVLMNDLSINYTLNLNLRFGANGSFAFIGGVPPTVVSGPHTETNVGPADGASWINELTTNGVWLDDQNWGSYVQWLTGGAVDLASPIHQTFAPNLIRSYPPGGPILPNDTFQIIRPTITFACRGISINATSANQQITPTDISGRVFLGNLNIDVQSATLSRPIHLAGDSSFVLSFLRVVTKVNVGALEISTRGGVNSAEFLDPLLDNYANSGISNFNRIPANGTLLSGAVVVSTDPIGSADCHLYCLGGNTRAISCIDITNRVISEGSVLLNRIVGGSLENLRGDLAATLIHLDGYPNHECYLHTGGLTSLDAVHFSGIFTIVGSPKQAIFIPGYGSVLLDSCTCTAPSPFSDYGIEWAGQATVQTRTDPATITGTLGDVYLKILGAPSAYPVLNAAITDLCGSWFVWI